MSEATTKSAQRTMEIFERFARDKRPLSLKDISTDLSYPVSSAAALLKSLVNLGYLEFNKSSRTYLPTMRLAVLGAWITEELFFDINISPLMESLRNETGESVLLATRSNLEVQYVHVSHFHPPIGSLAPAGARRPLARSGLGLLLLSTLSEQELEHTVRCINYEEKDRDNYVDLAGLEKTLVQIRKDGYVFSKGIYLPEVGTIGVLLPKAPFDRTFALGIVGPIERLECNFEVNLKAIIQTAQATAVAKP